MLLAIFAYSWIVTTALGHFLWNKVLTMMPAATSGQALALTPIGGFVLSVAIFGAVISAEDALSIGLIIAGIILDLAPLCAQLASC